MVDPFLQQRPNLVRVLHYDVVGLEAQHAVIFGDQLKGDGHARVISAEIVEGVSRVVLEDSEMRRLLWHQLRNPFEFYKDSFHVAELGRHVHALHRERQPVFVVEIVLGDQTAHSFEPCLRLWDILSLEGAERQAVERQKALLRVDCVGSGGRFEHVRDLLDQAHLMINLVGRELDKRLDVVEIGENPEIE